MEIVSPLTDEAGGIVKMVIPAGQDNPGTYVVVWNGHGDATGLWRVKADGTLELANSFTYGTWGEPGVTAGTNTATGLSYGDLAFRFLYVGRYGVQWDGAYGPPLYLMGARPYHATFGRFLQPDPTALEANLYGYAENSPVTLTDPDGTCAPCRLVDILRRAGEAASRWRIWDQLRRIVAIVRHPDLGRKLEFAFGRAGGTAHNLARTRENLRLLNNIGISDNSVGRKLVADALVRAYRSGEVVGRRLPGLMNGAGSVTIRSYVRGPRGYLIMESYWSGNKLVTVIFKAPSWWRVIRN